MGTQRGQQEQLQQADTILNARSSKCMQSSVAISPRVQQRGPKGSHTGDIFGYASASTRVIYIHKQPQPLRLMVAEEY